jgi:murein DD-endopeptidase MepM/ murein hydrolase activator NlpD
MLFEKLETDLKLQLLLIENASNIQDYAPVDLSEVSLQTKQINASSHRQLNTYLEKVRQQTNAKVLYGGYLEKRNLYANSKLFNSEQVRNIHLGVDFWAPSRTGILAPLDGVVHSAHYNKGEGNYGGTIILKHLHLGFTFYSLYGHLSKASLSLQKGEFIGKGAIFCHLGEPHENGNYVPHLHFQWILDLPENAVDYPGVCAAAQIADFARNSPKPNVIIENS